MILNVKEDQNTSVSHSLNCISYKFLIILQVRRKLPKAGWASSAMGAQYSPFVKLELTDLLKAGRAIAHPAHLSPTPLIYVYIQ